MTPGATEEPRPAPILTEDNAFYWEGAGRGLLLIQACGACGQLCHPPAPLCPVCHSPDRVPRRMSGRGMVASFIIVHHPPNPWFELPIAVATIDLDEGPRVIANICDVPMDEIELGQAVEVFFGLTDHEGVGVPLFRPARAS